MLILKEILKLLHNKKTYYSRYYYYESLLDGYISKAEYFRILQLIKLREQYITGIIISSFDIPLNQNTPKIVTKKLKKPLYKYKFRVS